MIFAETRDYNAFNVFFYLLSFGMLFLVVLMNDVLPTSVYQGNQWSMILASPLTWLMIIM